jgi:hypothetical protein
MTGNLIIYVQSKQNTWFIRISTFDSCNQFREVMRISKMAILSFPYHWEGGEEKPNHRAHRDIDRQLIEDWTLNIKPEK